MRLAKHCPVAGRYLVFNDLGGGSISDLFLRSGATWVDRIHRRISRRPRRLVRQVWTFVGVVWHGIVLSGKFHEHVSTSAARHNRPHGAVRRLSARLSRQECLLRQEQRAMALSQPADRPLAYAAAAAEHSGRQRMPWPCVPPSVAGRVALTSLLYAGDPPDVVANVIGHQ
jgi:hypothetical protein